MGRSKGQQAGKTARKAEAVDAVTARDWKHFAWRRFGAVFPYFAVLLASGSSQRLSPKETTGIPSRLPTSPTRPEFEICHRALTM